MRGRRRDKFHAALEACYREARGEVLSLITEREYRYEFKRVMRPGDGYVRTYVRTLEDHGGDQFTLFPDCKIVFGVPYPSSRHELVVCLHEFGHVAGGHNWYEQWPARSVDKAQHSRRQATERFVNDGPIIEAEVFASRYAITIMNRYGLLNRRTVRRLRRYLRTYGVSRDFARKALTLDTLV